MLIVIGEAEAAPGRRDQMLEAVAAMATATQSDEGCESYGFYADVTRPEVLLSVEVWRDRAALDAHMAHAHTQQFLATVPDLVAGDPAMRFFHAEPVQEAAR
ncbi:MAG: putative quinol monooxygenase [Nocardioides sp.]